LRRPGNGNTERGLPTKSLIRSVQFVGTITNEHRSTPPLR
jgi:hypothetical protein